MAQSAFLYAESEAHAVRVARVVVVASAGRVDIAEVRGVPEVRGAPKRSHATAGDIQSLTHDTDHSGRFFILRASESLIFLI